MFDLDLFSWFWINWLIHFSKEVWIMFMNQTNPVLKFNSFTQWSSQSRYQLTGGDDYHWIMTRNYFTLYTLHRSPHWLKLTRKEWSFFFFFFSVEVIHVWSNMRVSKLWIFFFVWTIPITRTKDQCLILTTVSYCS